MRPMQNPYKSAAPTHAHPLDQMAYLFESCAKHMFIAHEAIQKKDHYTRYYRSDKVIGILTGIYGTFDTENPVAAPLVEEMSAFIYEMIGHITKINFDNDEILCKKVANALLEMGKIWRAKAIEATKEQAALKQAAIPIQPASEAEKTVTV